MEQRRFFPHSNRKGETIGQYEADQKEYDNARHNKSPGIGGGKASVK